jgi:CRP-like cAMP-binding protein
VSDLAPALARCRVLRELSGDALDSLALLLEARDVLAGDSLFRAGDEADEVLVIAEGAVRLERNRQALGLLGPGEMLGGASLASVGLRACDAIADGDVRVLALSRGAYMQLRADHPSVALALHEGLLRELAVNVRALVEDSSAA